MNDDTDHEQGSSGPKQCLELNDRIMMYMHLLHAQVSV